ncbi:MAG: porin family protein [Campylobacterales bacterium]|nr:porin family protein [Campylobacterales bacterium]
MKKIINTLALGALLGTSSLFAGGDIAPAEVIVAPIPDEGKPNPFYIGVGINWVGVSRDCICYYIDRPDVVRSVTRGKDSLYGGIIRAGFDYNQYFGIEARALKTFWDKNSAEVTHYGLYLKPMMPINDRTNIYGLIGYGHTEVITDCSPLLYEKFTHNGPSFGIGLEYDLSDPEADREEGVHYDRPFDGHGDQEKGWGLFVDYQNLMHDEGPDKYRVNVVSFGVTYDF